MSSYFSQTALDALEATAMTAANYLDACDSGRKDIPLDPAYYQSCGILLFRIFSLVDANYAFPRLLELSSAAREMAESIQISRRIEVSRLGFYPELTVLLMRAGA